MHKDYYIKIRYIIYMMFQKKERETDLFGLSEMRFLCLRYAFALPSFLLRFNSVSSPMQVRSLEWEVNGSHMGLTWEVRGINRNEVNAP